MKIRENLYLIPDVAVFHPDEPAEIPDSPPLVAIEVRSQDDRMPDIAEKLEEYRAWGVPHAWLVDPYSKRFYVRDGALLETGSLRIPDLGVALTHADVFE